MLMRLREWGTRRLRRRGGGFAPLREYQLADGVGDELRLLQMNVMAAGLSNFTCSLARHSDQFILLCLPGSFARIVFDPFVPAA